MQTPATSSPAALFVCGSCGSEQVQRVSAIVSGGSWSGTSEGHAVAIGAVGDAFLGAVSASRVEHQGGTTLAQTLSPPPAPAPSQVLLFMVATAVVAGVVSFLAYYMEAQLLGFLAAVAAVACLVFGVRWGMRSANEHRHALERWGILVRRWELFLYCGRCHSVTEPSSRRHESAALMANLF